MFGKRIADYLSFQKVVLIALAAIGLLRLALSLSGLPNSTVRFFSMNAVAWAGTIYYGVAVYKRGFGGYKQLLPLVFFQYVVFQAIAVLGIVLAMAGKDNIYAAPEFSMGASSQTVHLLGHLTIGLAAATLVSWGMAALVMLVTRKVSPAAPLTGGA